MRQSYLAILSVIAVGLTTLIGCQQLGIDTERLFRPAEVPEIVGFLAGFGTTFAAVPDLLAMLRRRSSEGMNPRMGAIMGAFQILWIYYGFLIASRPVIIWKRNRRADQFHDRWRLRLLPAP